MKVITRMIKFDTFYQVMQEGLEQKLNTIVQRYPQFTSRQIREFAQMDPTGNDAKYLIWIINNVADVYFRWSKREVYETREVLVGLGPPPNRPITDEEVQELANRPGTPQNPTTGGMETFISLTTKHDPFSNVQRPANARGSLGGNMEDRLRLIDLTIDNWDDAHKVLKLLDRFMRYSRTKGFQDYASSGSWRSVGSAHMPWKVKRNPADVGSYTQRELFDIIDAYEKEVLGMKVGEIEDQQMQQLLDKAEVKVVVQDGIYSIYNIESDRAAKDLCADPKTKWCWGEGAWKTYHNRGLLYMITKRDEEGREVPYVAYHFKGAPMAGGPEIVDINDRPLGQAQAREVMPIMMKDPITKEFLLKGPGDMFVKGIVEGGQDVRDMNIFTDSNEGDMMSINDTLGEFELEFEGIGGVPIWVRLIGEMVKTKGDEHAVDFMKSLLKGSDDLEVLQTWLSRNVGGFRKVWHRSLAINLETDLEAHWRGESIIENIGMENAVGIIRYPYSGLPWNNFTIFNHMLPTPESRDFQVPPEYVKAVSKQIGPWVFDKQRSSYGVAQRLVRWLIEEADTRSGKLLFSQSIINLMRAHLTIPEDIKLKDGRGHLIGESGFLMCL